MPLNERQRRFVDFYLVSLNASQAGLQAGYSPKTAYSQAHDLLKKPEIQAAIEKAAAKLRARTGVSQERLIEEWEKIAFTDLSDFVEWGPNGAVLKDVKSLSPALRAAVAEVSQTITKDGGTIRLKLHDKQKALAEMAARLWPVVEHTESTITTRKAEDKLLEHYTIEELEAFLVMARERRITQAQKAGTLKE